MRRATAPGVGLRREKKKMRNMRVIAGTFKGRRLKAPSWEGLRPTSDHAPEAAIERASRVLAANGVLILEHARRQAAPASSGGLTRTRDVVSGDSALAFYSCPP